MEDPRIGNLSKEEAQKLKAFAESLGGADCMPAWMAAEIKSKTEDKGENEQRARPMNPTDEEIKITIAEACGWKVVVNVAGYYLLQTPAGKQKGCLWTNPQDPWKQTVGGKFRTPDYLNDLNAVHEAEKVLNTPIYMQKHAWNNYKALLEKITDGSSFHATARQRATALYLTLKSDKNE